MKRLLTNVFSLFIALVVGLITIWASKRYLKDPQIPLDWAVLIFSGVITAIIAFFVTWGHFQKDPTPPGNP